MHVSRCSRVNLERASLVGAEDSWYLEKILVHCGPPRNMAHEVSHDYVLCQSFANFSDYIHSHAPAENGLDCMLRGWPRAEPSQNLWGQKSIMWLQLPAESALIHLFCALATWPPEWGISVLYLIMAKPISWRLNILWGYWFKITPKFWSGNGL